MVVTQKHFDGGIKDLNSIIAVNVNIASDPTFWITDQHAFNATKNFVLIVIVNDCVEHPHLLQAFFEGWCFDQSARGWCVHLTKQHSIRASRCFYHFVELPHKLLALAHSLKVMLSFK